MPTPARSNPFANITTLGDTVSDVLRDPLNNIPDNRIGNPVSAQKFLSSINRSGIASPARFEVIFTLPSSVQSALKSAGTAPGPHDLNYLSMRCTQAEFPGRTLSSIPIQHGSTAKREFPYEEIYNEIEFTFLLSEDMYERQVFDVWSDVIYNANKKDFAFYSNYVSTVLIRKFTYDGGASREVKLIEAYPRATNPFELDHSLQNTAGLQTISMNFFRWEIDSNPSQNFPEILLPEPARDLLSQYDSVLEPVDNILDTTGASLDRVSRIGNF